MFRKKKQKRGIGRYTVENMPIYPNKIARFV
jgi:hypothetical protein